MNDVISSWIEFVDNSSKEIEMKFTEKDLAEFLGFKLPPVTENEFEAQFTKIV